MIQNPSRPILLVDDEKPALQSALIALKHDDLTNVIGCSDSTEVMSILEHHPVSAVVLDIMMPAPTGIELLAQIVSRYPGVPVIMLTAVFDVDTVVGCMKAGAFDYIIKPIDNLRLLTTVRRAIEYFQMAQENSRLRHGMITANVKNPEHFRRIVTRDNVMCSIFRYIEAIAVTSWPVLITGESGTGKELIARAIHDASGRDGEFVALNVAGLDDALFSDTLFGHEKGAFTGAERRRTGLISRAEGGTLFLDEIGALSVDLQVKLLRLLEERSYYPVGSDIPVSVTARIVTATNEPVEKLRASGAFRSDLF